ncbi:MAG TPA: hypothetical protein VI217_14860 [Mycobacterium sp.]
MGANAVREVIGRVVGQLPLLARASWAPGRSRHRAATSHGTGWAGTAGLVIITAEAMAPAMNNTALT